VKNVQIALFREIKGLRVNSGRARFNLHLLGPFRLHGPDGRRIDISSKKAQALIAMLAVAGGGERTRSWLQTQLWGSRGADQAQASLRSELSALRRLVNTDQVELLGSDKSRLWIHLDRIDVDIRSPGQAGGEEFLEGLDLATEEGFEDWLRAERQRIRERAILPRESEPAPPALTMAMPSPDFAALPALAVLPFANMTGDPALDMIAEGMGDDLLERLSRLRWLPIIARSSSFSFEGDAATAAKALGARYILEGKLRPAGNGNSLSASLSDSEAGQVLWSGKLALADASSIDLEDLLTGLTSTLASRIDRQEQNLALRKSHSDLNVRELIWRGRWHFNRLTRDDAEQARMCFARALEREPNSPEALIQSTWARVWQLWVERGSDDDIRAVRRQAQKAIIADYDDARGHMLAGIAEIWLRQPLRAEALLRKAIELNPSLAMAYAQLGCALNLRGEAEDALAILNTAVRLSPNDVELFFFLGELAMANLLLGQHAEALDNAEQAIIRRTAYWQSHVVKVIALFRRDQTQDAQGALQELISMKRSFTADFIDWIPFVDPNENAKLKRDLNQVAALRD
jgi:TolB-like protein/cytochrome c-type biogenesis protein CcmH/NrfG